MNLFLYTLAVAGLAVVDTTSTDILDAILKGGPFAIVLALIVADKLGTNSERDRLRVENLKLLAEANVQNEKLQSEILPSIIEMNRLMTRVVALLEDIDHPRAKR